MLVLSRKVNERIRISDNIEITVVEIRGNKVRLGITAPPHVPIHRSEVAERIRAEAEQDLDPTHERNPSCIDC